MLPSHGLLKSFPCPYYISGFCERPHCLFRHERKDAVQALKSAQFLQSSVDEDNPEEADVAFSSKENKYDQISSRKNYSSSHKKEEVSYSPTPSNKVSSRKEKYEDKPTISKTYVTPLNQSLPLPAVVFERDDLKKTPESVKRSHNDPAENCSKRRKISDSNTETLPSFKNENAASDDVNSFSTEKKTEKPPKVGPESEEKVSNEKIEKGDKIKNVETESVPSIPVKPEKPEKRSSTDVRKDKKSSSSSSRKDDKKSRHKERQSGSSQEKSRGSSHSSRSHSSHSHKSKHSDSSNKKSDSKHRKSSSNGSKRSDKHSDKSKDRGSSSHRSSNSKSSKSSRSSHKNTDKSDKNKDSDSFLHKEVASVRDVPEEFRFPEYDDDDEDDPDEVAMECLKMFEDYSADDYTAPTIQNTAMSDLNDSFDIKDVEDDGGTSKKRLAHSGADQRSALLAARNSSKELPKMTHTSLNKLMIQRIQAAVAKSEERGINVPAAQQSNENPRQSKTDEVSASSALKSATQSIVPGGKKRIAHVSNVNMLIKPLSIIQSVSSTSKGNGPSTNKDDVKSPKESSTIAQTNTKGQSRVAHAPVKGTIQSSKPMITLEAASINTKVPLAMRQKILFQMYQECLKWLPDSEAAEKARKEEAEVAGRCSSKMVYFSAATNVITRIRKGPSNDNLSNANPSHENTQKLSGSAGPKVSWSIESNSKKSFKVPIGVDLFQRLQKFLLTEEDLKLHGYPLPHPSGEPGRAIAKRRSETKPVINGTPDPTKRHCERCSKPYRTDDKGMPIIIEKCVHHFGRRYTRKTKGLLESRYSCCEGEIISEGCSVAPTHISAIPGSEDDLKGYVSAVKDPGDDNVMGTSIWDIIALDCEMVSTTVGSELARVTIVDCHKKILYDQLVMPPHPILDYNTRFSGLTEEILQKGPTVSLIQVQAVLLTQLKPNSILIGHSLESDLHALKIIHRTIIDTSVLFPHRLGLPLKRALRNLSAEYCGKIIQSSVNGHNSSEDALAALELVFYKVKELG